VALNIRSSSASSSSTSTSPLSGTKSSATDLFAQGMAAAAKIAQQSSAAKTPQPKHTPSAPKPAAKPVSSAKPKPAAHHSDDSQSKSTAAKSSRADSKPKAAQSTQTAADAPSDGSHPDDGAVAAEANADTNTANGAKGRGSATRAPAKTNAAQSAATKASDAADDPTSADSTNQSGLSLIQLLARSLESEDTDVQSTDASAPAATDETAADGKTSDDPNAIALAMFSQALAAALAMQQTPTGNAATANTGDATGSIGSATQSPGGPESVQNLMTALAHGVAAGAQSKSDDGAAQFNVDPTKTDVTNAGTADSTAAAPSALAHLGVASHFAAQHLRNDTNTADLKSPVGTSAWEEEIGAHLTWMTQKGLETGSLRVSPEHLGPLEVNISVQNGDASVWFAANHPDTRAALEQALPRLREMFANQGMNLADSGVSRQNLSHQGSRNQSRPEASQAVSGVSAVGSTDAGSTSASRINLGLVDLYA
jgi:flagellar hook-length control protein FliK